jgi:hypothetical protein
VIVFNILFSSACTTAVAVAVFAGVHQVHQLSCQFPCNIPCVHVLRWVPVLLADDMPCSVSVPNTFTHTRSLCNTIRASHTVRRTGGPATSSPQRCLILVHTAPGAAAYARSRNRLTFAPATRRVASLVRPVLPLTGVLPGLPPAGRRQLALPPRGPCTVPGCE